MLKRKSTNSVLSFNNVLNDINDWLAEENSENDEIVGDLNELCGEEEIDSNPSEGCLEEEQQSEEPEYIGILTTKIWGKKIAHSQSKRSQHWLFIRWTKLQRNCIYEQRWCFGRTLWLSWYKERQKHKKI